MEHLDYGNFDINNADIAFSEENKYTNPASEIETRKQLSFPLKEIKTFLYNVTPIDSSNNVIQLGVASDGKIRYRSVAGGSWTNAGGPTIYSGTTEPSSSLGDNGDIYFLYEV